MYNNREKGKQFFFRNKNELCSFKRTGTLFKKIFTVSFLFIVLISTFSENVYSKELNARDIIQKVDDREDGDDRFSKMKMTLINRNGEKRVREIENLRKDYGKDSKSIMFFRSPSDVKGTGFLQFEYDDINKEDDRWLYLPALRRVRRISGNSKGDYFMGSDFTYDDMGDRNVDEDIHIYLKDEEVNGFDCYVIESTSKDKDDLYSRKIQWVAKDIFVVIKVDYYDRRNNHFKTFNVEKLEKIDNIYTPKKLVMDNFSVDHKTILEFSDIKYNIGVNGNNFKINNLEKGRLRL